MATEQHDLDQVVFPVILIHREEGIEPATTAAELRLATRAALESGYFDALELFDAAGRRFIFQAAHPIADLGEAGITRLLRLAFDLSAPEPIDFADLREQAAASTEHTSAQEQLRAAPDFPALFAAVLRLHPYDL